MTWVPFQLTRVAVYGEQYEAKIVPVLQKNPNSHTGLPPATQQKST